MNGLKIIRIQCNYSVSELAEEIGVSRQMISAWENGKKSIPANRKIQLGEYFGIEPELIGEINEQEKRDIVNRTIYRWRNDKTEHFRFKPQKEDAEEPMIWLEKQERKNTISEELQEKKKEQKPLLERMESQADQIKGDDINSRISSLNRWNDYYKLCADNFEQIIQKEPHLKMYYFYKMLEMQIVLGEVFGAADTMYKKIEEASIDDSVYSIDRKFIKECAQYVKKHMAPAMEELEEANKDFIHEKAETALFENSKSESKGL